MTLQVTKSGNQPITVHAGAADPRRGLLTEVIQVVPLTAIRKRVILVTCVLLLVAIGVNVQLLVDLSAAGIRGGAELSSDRPLEAHQRNNSTIRDALASTKARSLVLLMSTLACLACIGYVVARKTVSPPVETMTRTLEEIAAGNLNVTAPVLHSDQIGNLGIAVNEVAANYQEVLLFAGTVVGNSLPALESIEKTLEGIASSDSGEQIKQQLELVKGELEKLGSVIQDFQFYEVYFDGRQALPLPPVANERCKPGITCE